MSKSKSISFSISSQFFYFYFNSDFTSTIYPNHTIFFSYIAIKKKKEVKEWIYEKLTSDSDSPQYRRSPRYRGSCLWVAGLSHCGTSWRTRTVVCRKASKVALQKLSLGTKLSLLIQLNWALKWAWVQNFLKHAVNIYNNALIVLHYLPKASTGEA